MPRSLPPLALAIALSALTLLSPLAQAIPMKAFTISDLVERSDAVVLGRVGAHTAHFDKTRNRIYTTYTITVAEPVFGAVRGAQISVRLMGGVLGERTMTISDNAKLQEGEEIFVFLKADQADKKLFYISAMSQGKYTVLRDEGGARLVRGPATTEAGPGANRLDEMAARVRKLHEQPAATKEVR